MAVGGGEEREGGVQRQEEGTSSKRRRSVEEYGKDDSERGGKKYARVDTEGNRGEDDESSGSDYIPEDTGSDGNGTSNEALETESECSDVGDGNKGEEERSRRGRRSRSSAAELEVLWRAFEEENLMGSSGSDFEGVAERVDEDSEEVSLVEESDIGEVDVDVSGAVRDGEGSVSEGISPTHSGGRRKKVVRCEERRLRRKAAGDGVVHGGKPLDGEKGRVVTVKGRCTLDRLVTLNNSMTEYQKEAVRGSVLAPVLKYCSLSMERNLALALVKAWVPRRRAFRLGERLVLFSVFDVALLTGMPATGERVDFSEEHVTTEIGDLVRQRVNEVEQQELRRRKGRARGKDNRVFKNFVAAMVYQCERFAGEEHLPLWLKMYTWFVLSGVFFPRGVYVAAWELERYANDVAGMSQYAWAEAIWRYLVEALDDMQRRLPHAASEIQFNGFSTLLQVREKLNAIIASSFVHVNMWLYALCRLCKLFMLAENIANPYVELRHMTLM